MIRRIANALLIGCFCGSLAAAAPPGRPLPLTHAQYTALSQLEQEPQHAAVRLVHATYQSEHEQQMERTRMVNDATTLATFAGYIGAIATLLILGAPL
jgi:hypothetical protein